jgi:4-amino-4-deoxy-L-arabinose transferase-like glycosyltransferase
VGNLRTSNPDHACSAAGLPEGPFTSTIGNRSPLASEKGLFLFATVGSAIYLLPFMRVLLARTDEGTFLVGAARILRGQVFARDFVEVMGPGTFYWLAAFYRVFGENVFATRACLFLSWMATATLVHLLSRNVNSPNRLLPVTLIIVTGFSSLGIGISHHIDSNCLTLLVVLCLLVWYEKRSLRWLILAGALAALTAVVHQPKGLLLLLAAGVWIWMMERKQGHASRALIGTAAGFAGILGITVVYFAAHGALTDVIRASLVWPFQHYSAINQVPYAYGTFKFNWRGAPLSTPGSYCIFLLACLLMAPFLYVVVVPAVLALQIWLGRLRPMPANVSLYLLCGLALWISELHRKDIVHLVFGSPLLVIVSIQLLSHSGRMLSRLALVVLTASSCTLAVCNLMVVLTAHTVSTRVGNVAMFEGGEELAALHARVAPGEEIFVYPYCPSYYFLVQTENPTRFSILQSGYNTPGEVREVIRVLESRKVRHVFWDTNFRKRSLALVFPAALQLPDDLAPLETYLRERYIPVYSQNGFQILERRHEPNGD